MRDSFSTYHPIVNFTYFALVLGFSMWLMHPICLAISLGAGIHYALYLNGKKQVKFGLSYLMPMMIIAAIVNPAFNHQGVTVLTYLPSGNPLTLESMVYGVAAAAMMGAVVTWFCCYSAVMTSDKFIYLFGRIIPALSLVLSMTLRFVPKFKGQIQAVQQSQQAIGRDSTQGSIVHRMKLGITVLSIMVTWSLENAIETADSMKSRGYGLTGRTAFSIYVLDERDRITLSWLTFCGVYLASGGSVGALSYQYYPMMTGAPMAPFTLSFYAVYLALCATPMRLNRKEERTWKGLSTIN